MTEVISLYHFLEVKIKVIVENTELLPLECMKIAEIFRSKKKLDRVENSHVIYHILIINIQNNIK
jgi:hypothetical protein